jgi:putative hydrolase of the HAD superfamily
MDQAFRAAWKAAKTGAAGRLTTADKEWWRELVFRALAILKIDTAPEIREAYFETLYEAFVQPEAWRIYPDVIATLQAVRNHGVHVGVISNWDARLRPLLERLELTPFFDSVTISCEVGVEKPAAAIFQAALNRAGLTAEQAIHVGDSESEDVRGAIGVGMSAMMVRQTDGPDGGLGQVLRRLR